MCGSTAPCVKIPPKDQGKGVQLEVQVVAYKGRNTPHFAPVPVVSEVQPRWLLASAVLFRRRIQTGQKCRGEVSRPVGNLRFSQIAFRKMWWVVPSTVIGEKDISTACARRNNAAAMWIILKPHVETLWSACSSRLRRFCRQRLQQLRGTAVGGRACGQSHSWGSLGTITVPPDAKKACNTTISTVGRQGWQGQA